jgi:hypothetical protein
MNDSYFSANLLAASSPIDGAGLKRQPLIRHFPSKTRTNLIGEPVQVASFSLACLAWPSR